MGEAKRRGTYEQRRSAAIESAKTLRDTRKANRSPTPKLSPQAVAVLAMAGVAGFSINQESESDQ